MKKILSMLIIIMLLMNSSVLMLTSLAVDEENNVSMAEMELSKNQLTNKTQNEIIINGILKRNSQNDILYENPTISFEFPNEIEKIVINDIKILYDNELTIKEYKIEENENGNKVLKIFLDGKQTQLQADGIVKGTNIRVSANIIVKTDIKAGEKQIKMTCVDGNDQSKSATCESNIKLVNAYEINTTTMVKDEINGITINQNGLEINIKPIIGNSELQNNSVIYTNEIIKYDITVKNTTENEIKNMFFNGEIETNEEIYITNLRHKNLLREALESLKLVKGGIEAGVSEDFLTIDMMNAYEKLGLIIGEEVEDDLADRIFEKFCMGK